MPESVPLDLSLGREPTEPLTDDEFFRMSDQATNSWSGQRNIMIMDFMLRTGARVGEVVELDYDDVDFDGHIVKLSPAKWDSERALKLDSDFFARFDGFANGEDHPDSEFVFSTATGGDLSTRYVREFVEEYAGRAGLDTERVHPHLFRHTFASRLLETTENLRMVQQALGHNDLKTTFVYLHTLPEETAERVRGGSDLDLASFSEKLPNLPTDAEPV